MKRNCLVASLVGALVFAPAAQAGVATFDHFSVEYFGGVGESAQASQSGNTLTFSNLGYLASVTLPAGGGDGEASYKSGGGMQLTLDPGYQFTGISWSAQGTYRVQLPEIYSHVSYAHALTDIRYGGGYAQPADFGLNLEANFATNGSGVYNVSQNMGNFQYASNEWGNALRYATFGRVEAIGPGASASITHDSVSFTFNVTAVPEPETYAMLLAGLGLMGFVARRRKQSQA